MSDVVFQRDLFAEAVKTARTVIAGEGFPPALDDLRLWGEASALAADHMWTEGKEIERGLPEHDPTDPAARSVVAAMLWQLSRADFMAPEEVEAFLPSRKDLLRRYVSFAPPSSIGDLGLLRWEVHAAAVTDNLERVVALGRRWEELDPKLTDLSDVARVMFLLIHPSRPKDWKPSKWDPGLSAPSELREHYEALHGLATVVLATSVNGSAALPALGPFLGIERAAWIEPTTFGRQVLDAIHLAYSWLERVERRTGVLASVPSLVRCWYDFALARADSDLGRLRRAASGYISLSKELASFGIVQIQGMESFTIPAAVHCLLLAEQFPDAERLIRDLIKDAPDDAGLRRQLTECLIRQERMPEAAVAFAEYVARHSGDREDTWLSPLVMHLGAQVMSHQTIATAIENAALFAPARPLGERLMKWYSPWTASMSVEASRKWWIALYWIGSDEVHHNIGDDVWGQAIVCFAEAVALELKVKIFKPAGSTHSNATGEVRDTWRKALVGRATLGEMVECLLQTRRPETAVAKIVRRHIDERFPGLSRYLRTRGQDLTLLNELRRRAQHGDLDSMIESRSPITQKDTETVFRTATEVLQLLNS